MTEMQGHVRSQRHDCYLQKRPMIRAKLHASETATSELASTRACFARGPADLSGRCWSGSLEARVMVGEIEARTYSILSCTWTRYMYAGMLTKDSSSSRYQTIIYLYLVLGNQ